VIDKVTIRNWKRFEQIEFDLERRHIVLVGPNNCGKTTVLQAIAAWGFALRRWRQTNHDLNERNGWQRIPITLEQFVPVSVRSFDLLWRDRQAGKPIEIEVSCGTKSVGMEFEADPQSPFQMFVRPTHASNAPSIESLTCSTLFVPAMTGMLLEEPVLTKPKIEQMLGRNRPGEVLRNLVADVAGDPEAWRSLKATVVDLFGIELLDPDAAGADIVADYRQIGGNARFDLASAGSGFQQVVMLLAFLERQRGSILLLDEPDAHLHVFLQERIVEVLRDAATRSGSLLVAATHSEVILDSVDYDEICVLMEKPQRLVDDAGKATLKDALRVIDHEDLAKARLVPGVLYLEDYTDLAILREFARVLGHPAANVLGPAAYWRKVVASPGSKRPGISAQDHFDALRLARPGYPGFQLVDGDSKEEGPRDKTYGTPPKRRWPRYEIESYLVQPESLERFVLRHADLAAGLGHVQRMRDKMAELLTSQFVADPMSTTVPAQAVLKGTKASTELLPPILEAGGLPAFPKKRFHELAAQMMPSEIHQDVRDVLDAICTAFGIPLASPAPAGGAP